MQYRAGRYPPVSLSGIGKNTRISVGDSQLHQVSPSCADSFPLLPKHHADTFAHPLVNALEVRSHIRQLVVVHPADHIPFQVYLTRPSLISLARISISLLWLTVSKNFSKSISTVHTLPAFRYSLLFLRASWALRFGRKP